MTLRPPPLGFVGLGVMGRPMASHLAAAGHAITLYDIAPGLAADVAATLAGAKAARTRGFPAATGHPAMPGARRNTRLSDAASHPATAHGSDAQPAFSAYGGAPSASAWTGCRAM